MKLTDLFNDFFRSEKAGGLLLILVTFMSIVIANSSLGNVYTGFWDFEFAGHSITHWINDGLMTIFFLLIGLELEREIYIGELSNIKNAAMPIAGAIGGMIVPACIFLLINYGMPSQSGAGIPMATDIAFALGVLSLLGNKVPASLKVFITAFAVIDDLGAIIVIALFYTGTLNFISLLVALGIFAVMIVCNRLKIYYLIIYLAGGAAMWFFMLDSGIHPTITGVLLAFAIPFGDGGKTSPSYVIQHVLHKPVAFVILPLFALANTSIPVSSDWYTQLNDPAGIGIILGLFVGKPAGICLFILLGIAFRLCALPGDLKKTHILGAGFLGGIGFTMSIFISLLAFDNHTMVNAAKIAILAASCLSAICGYIWLKLTLRKVIPVD